MSGPFDNLTIDQTRDLASKLIRHMGPGLLVQCCEGGYYYSVIGVTLIRDEIQVYLDKHDLPVDVDRVVGVYLLNPNNGNLRAVKPKRKRIKPTRDMRSLFPMHVTEEGAED